MVLAGQRPEMIMEICSRAMSFWVYQVRYSLVCVSVCLCVCDGNGISFRRTRSEPTRSTVPPRPLRKPNSKRATMTR